MAVELHEITQFAAFAALPPASLGALAATVELVPHQAGAIFYHDDDPPSGLFLLSAGNVVLYRQSHERLQILALIQPGECFGAESIATHRTCPYTAKAISAGQTYRIPPDALYTLLTHDPAFLGAFLSLVALRLRQLTTLVHDLAFRDIAGRLAGILLMLAEPSDDGWLVRRIFSQQELASMAGTVREVVNRCLKRFAQDDLLKITPHAYHILDIEALNSIATNENH